jgi:ribosomal protein L37AE/L43A
MIVLFFGLFSVVFWRIRAARVRKAMAEDIDSSACIACDSSDLEVLGPGAYRCSACGYEGGDGLSALHEAAEQASVDKLEPAERRKQALAEVRQARDLVLGAQGTLKSSLSHSRGDMMGRQSAWEEKQMELTSALGELGRAEALVRRAAMLLDDPAIQVDLSDFDSFSNAFFADIRADRFSVDLKVHGEIKRVAGEAEGMLEELEKLVAVLAG